LIGVGAGAAGTVATLLIVNFAARSEWEPRIGWLQSFNGAGQLLGLLLGGAFAHGQSMIGFLVGGALIGRVAQRDFTSGLSRNGT
jgi:fucose permease